MAENSSKMTIADQKNHQIKFFSKDDYSMGNNLIKVKEFLYSFDLKTSVCNVNEALKLVNVIKYIESGRYLLSWSDEEIARIKKHQKPITIIIGKFFNGLDDLKITELFSQVHNIYNDDLIEQFNKYKLYVRLTPRSLEEVLVNKILYLPIIMKYQSLVNYYPDIIKK